MECKICKKKIKNYIALGLHLKKEHSISSKEYYDRYLRKENEGICPECNKETTFQGIRLGYLKFCCPTCAQLNKETRQKYKETCFKKYSVENTFQAEVCKEKMKQTNLKNLGVEYPQQSEKVRIKSEQTKQILYGNKNYNNISKMKETCLKKFGVDSYSKTEEYINKFKKTCNKKYGVDFPFQCKEILNKGIKTNFEKYGCKNPMQYYEVRKKALDTMYKNGTSSSLEYEFIKFLTANNIKFEYNYNKDKRYPYFCDFYLPNLDTFIEINAFWVHGKHFFNENNKDDIKILNKWKKKAKKSNYYKYAIYIWTVSDLQKRDCAIKNNLNYIVLWNKQDIERYKQTLVSL